MLGPSWGMSSRRRALGAFAILHYAAAILVGSFLLFQVQPMIARFILPWFGGSPAVWTTCLLFFQVALLAGYAYAHSLADRVELRRQALVHVALLAASLAALPIVPSLAWKAAAAAGSHPVLVILSLLAGTIGAPYVLLSSTSPLLQHWFERTRPGRSPYRLFALSNLGSLLGLVAYPFVVEPLLRLRAQANLWSAAYALYAGLCAVCAVEAWRRSRGAGAVVAVREPAPGIALRDRLWWLLLAATGTLMLMATSNHVVQDVASVPFLWVLPLALYLCTLVLCFENERWAVPPAVARGLCARSAGHRLHALPPRHHAPRPGDRRLLGHALQRLHGRTRRAGAKSPARRPADVVLPPCRGRRRAGRGLRDLGCPDPVGRLLGVPARLGRHLGPGRGGARARDGEVG